jgi:hypothetical protein
MSVITSAHHTWSAARFAGETVSQPQDHQLRVEAGSSLSSHTVVPTSDAGASYHDPVPPTGEYEPSSQPRVRDHAVSALLAERR